MINVTQDFLTAIRAADRKLEIKVQIGTVELDDNQIVEYSIERNLGSGNAPTIGSVPSAKLQLSILKSEMPLNVLGEKIIPWVGLELPNSTIEWVKMGEFYVNPNEIETEKMIVNMTAFDEMASYNFVYDSQLSYPTALTNVLTEMSTQFGIDFAAGWENITINTKLEGTVRQVLGLIATLLTKNAIINRNGEVEFVFTNQTSFSLNEDNYIDFKLTADSNVRMSQMVVQTEDEQEFIVGDSNGFAMFLENSAIQTEAELQTIFNRHYPMFFFAYDLQLQGMPHIELGDIISLTDVEGVQRNIIILNHKLTFQGGLISEFSVEAPESDTIKVDNRSVGGVVGDSVRKVYEDMDAAIANATQLITGNEGGFIVTRVDAEGKPYEILIMDNEDINLATNVWRWNSAGLGYSSSGYTGTYDLAITADGQIVADFITTGTLNAQLIKTGVLKSFNNASWINMEDGTFNLGNGLISFDGTNFSIDLSSTSIQDDIDASLESAKEYAEAQATAAQTAAETYALAEAEAKAAEAQAQAEATAQGYVSAETTARLAEAQANLTEAKEYAEAQAQAAEDNAITHTNTQFNVLTGEINLRVTETTFNSGIDSAKAHADNIKTDLDGDIAEVDGKVDGALTRIEEAEIKITPDAITSTVISSEEYQQDQSAIDQNARNYAETEALEKARDILGVTQHIVVNSPVYDEEEYGGEITSLATRYGLHFEIENDIHLGQVSVITDGIGKIEVLLRKVNGDIIDGNFETVRTWEFQVRAGRNNIYLNEILEVSNSSTWHLSARGLEDELGNTVGMYRTGDIIDYPVDAGSLTFLNGGAVNNVNNRWYYFFNVEVAGRGVRGKSDQRLEELESRITQTVEDIQFDFMSYSSNLDSLSDYINGEDEELGLRSFFNFSADGLYIGNTSTNDPFSLLIANDRISFRDGGNEVAWINQNTLHIRTAEVLESLVMGNHQIQKQTGSNEITVIKWVGGN